jgi:hypothetical protein
MYRSRLQRIEEKRNIRKASLLVFITVLLIIAAAIVGIPLLTRMALFFSSFNAQTGNDKLDNIPPAAPQLVLPYEATNSATISIEGYAEAGSTVYLTQNVETDEITVTEDDGTFIFEDLALKSGENVFSAVAMDKAGNKSLTSAQKQIIYSHKSPKLVIDTPTDRQVVTGESNRMEIKGSTDSGNRVSVNERNIIVGSSGAFTGLYYLANGENVLVFISQDLAGNQTRKEMTVTYNP